MMGLLNPAIFENIVTSWPPRMKTYSMMDYFIHEAGVTEGDIRPFLGLLKDHSNWKKNENTCKCKAHERLKL